MAAFTVESQFERLMAQAEAHPVRGWDFSWLGSRMVTEPLPWDYDSMVLSFARTSPDMLDLGTGGGEWLAGLSYRPPRTVATESWGPNIDVAAARLRPLGVTLTRTECAPDNTDQRPDETRGSLPFPAESFQLVVARHESFVPREVSRILVPDGRFITQQVGGGRDDFARLLGFPTSPGTLGGFSLVAQVEAAGLRVESFAQCDLVTTFADVGAFAWYLRATPWTLPCFSLRGCRGRLFDVHSRISTDGPVSVRIPASCMEATKLRAPEHSTARRLRSFTTISGGAKKLARGHAARA
jgi:SAM-dependent methyltransferase